MKKLRPRQEQRAAPGHSARARAENQAFLPAPQLPLLVEVVMSQARHLTRKPFLMTLLSVAFGRAASHRGGLSPLIPTSLAPQSRVRGHRRHHPCATAPPAARALWVGDGHGLAPTAQHSVRTGGHLHMVCLPPHKRAHVHTPTWPQPSSSWAQCTVKGSQSTFPLTVTHISHSSFHLLCTRQCSRCPPSTI